MTKEQCIAKLEELYPTLIEYLRERTSSLLCSGAVDLDEFVNNYALPKILLCAALKDSVDAFTPIGNRQREILKDLESF
jgi:hypothetical protein